MIVGPAKINRADAGFHGQDARATGIVDKAFASPLTSDLLFDKKSFAPSLHIQDFVVRPA